MYFNAKTYDPDCRTYDNFGNNEITVTSRMLLKNGRPWIPVMGEMHYSRVP